MQHIGRNTMGRSFPRTPPARLPMLNMTLGKPDFDHKYNILPDISGLREQMEEDSEYEEYNPYGQQAGEAYTYGEQAGEVYNSYGEQAGEAYNPYGEQTGEAYNPYGEQTGEAYNPYGEQAGEAYNPYGEQTGEAYNPYGEQTGEAYNPYGEQTGEAYNPYGEQAGAYNPCGEQAAKHHWHSSPVGVVNQRGMDHVPREIMRSTQREFMGPIHRESGPMMPINRAHEPMMPIKRNIMGPIRRESDPMLPIKGGVMGPIRRESDPMMPIKREAMGPIRRESDPMLPIKGGVMGPIRRESDPMLPIKGGVMGPIRRESDPMIPIKREVMGPIRRESDPMIPIKREAMGPIRRESEQLIDGFYNDAHGDAFGLQRIVPQNHNILPQPVLPKPGNEFAPMKNDVISNAACLDRTFIGGNVRDLSLYGTKNILLGICKSGDSAQLRDQVKNGGLMKRVESSHALNMGMARESAPLMAIKPANMQEDPDCKNEKYEGQGQIRIVEEKFAQMLNEDTPKHKDNVAARSFPICNEMKHIKNVPTDAESSNDERMVSGHFDDSVKVDRREKLGIESPTDSNKLCAYETSDDEYPDIKDDKDMKLDIKSRDMLGAHVINPQRDSVNSVNHKVEIKYETEDDDEDGQSCKTESKRESESQRPQASDEFRSEDEESICYEEMPVSEGTIVVQTGNMKCFSHEVDIDMESDEEESISYEEMPVPEGTIVVQTGNMKCVRHNMEAESESDDEESISYEEMPVPEGTIVVQTGNMKCVSHDMEMNSDDEYMEAEKAGSGEEKNDIRAKDVTYESGQTGPAKGIDKESGVRKMDTIDVHQKVFGEYANLGKDPVHKLVSEDVDIKEDNAQEMTNDSSSAQPSSLNSSNKRSGIVVIAKEPDAVRRRHRKRKQERDDRKKSVEKEMTEETKSVTASSSTKSKPKLVQSKSDVVSNEKPKTVESKSEQMSNETDDDIENISDKILDQESESSAKDVSEPKEMQVNAESSKKVTFNRILAVYTFQPDSCSSSDSSTIKCRNESGDGDIVYDTDDEIGRVPNEILDEPEPAPKEILGELDGEKQDSPKQSVADKHDIAKHMDENVQRINEVTESNPAEPKGVHVTYEKQDTSEMAVADVLVTSQVKEECINKVEPVHGVSHIHVHIHISHDGNECTKKSNEIAAKSMPVEPHEDLTIKQVVDDMRITKDKNGGKQKRLPPFDLASAREGRGRQKRIRKGDLAKPNFLGPDRNIPDRNKRHFKRGGDIVAAGDSSTGSFIRNRRNVEHTDEHIKLLESPTNIRNKQRHSTNTHKTNEQCFKPPQKNHIEPLTSRSLRSDARKRLMEILDVDRVPDRVATTLLESESVTAIMNEYNTNPLQYGQHYLDLLKLREEKPYIILSHHITDPSKVEDNRPWNYYDRLKIYELSSEYRNGLNEKLDVNKVSLNEKAQTDVNRDVEPFKGAKNKDAKKSKQKNKEGSSEGGQRRKFSLKSFFRRLICVCK